MQLLPYERSLLKSWVKFAYPCIFLNVKKIGHWLIICSTKFLSFLRVFTPPLVRRASLFLRVFSTNYCIFSNFQACWSQNHTNGSPLCSPDFSCSLKEANRWYKPIRNLRTLSALLKRVSKQPTAQIFMEALRRSYAIEIFRIGTMSKGLNI